jgi:hypothetical protein
MLKCLADPFETGRLDFTSGHCSVCFNESMFRKLTVFAALASFCLTPLVHAGGKGGEEASISFHIETDANENPKMIFPQLVNGKTRYFRRISEVSTRDIASFSPFPSDDGQSYGVVFKLKDHAARRLSAITSVNLDRWLAARANGRVIDAVIIDQQINDGTLVVWKGVNLTDIALLDESFIRTGEKEKRK